MAWIGFAVARNKDACPSHPRVLESDGTPAFLLLLLLLLLPASAAGASAATAAAAAAAALFVGPARCFIFYSNSCESSMVVDVVQNPQKSNVYEYEKKTRTLCWRL